MADKEFSGDNGLPLAGPLTGSEVVAVTQNGDSVHTDLATLAQMVKETTATTVSQSDFRGVRAILDEAKTIPGKDYMSFNSVQFDTDGFWTMGSPTRLTIPAGVVKVEVRAVLQGGANYVIEKNTNERSTAMSGFNTTGVIPVVEGDFFELFNVDDSNSGNEPGNMKTFFEVVVIEHNL